MSEIADMLKRESYDNVKTKTDKNTMKCKLHVMQSVLSFDLDDSIPSLLGLKKQEYLFGKFTASRIVDIMGFITINIHCYIISGVKDNS